MGNTTDGIKSYYFGKLILPDRNSDNRWQEEVDGSPSIVGKDGRSFYIGDPSADPRGRQALDHLGISHSSWKKGLEGIKSLTAATSYLEYLENAEKLTGFVAMADEGSSLNKFRELEDELAHAKVSAREAGLVFDAERAEQIRGKVERYAQRDKRVQNALDALYDGNQADAKRYLKQAEDVALEGSIPFDKAKYETWLAKASQISELSKRMSLDDFVFTENVADYLEDYPLSERAQVRMHQALGYTIDKVLPWNPDRQQKLLHAYYHRGVDTLNRFAGNAQRWALPQLKNVIYPDDLSDYLAKVREYVHGAKTYLEFIYDGRKDSENFKRQYRALDEPYKNALAGAERLARSKALSCHQEGHAECAANFFAAADKYQKELRDFSSKY